MQKIFIIDMKDFTYDIAAINKELQMSANAKVVSITPVVSIPNNGGNYYKAESGYVVVVIEK